ncbi:MAG TPA: alpha/beta hydrolase [Paracoccaceae bacterium]|nr:alpha/beta hydrolase [Paracoccaceae bacterium]
MVAVVLVPGHLCTAEWLYAPQIEALAGRETVLADTTRDDTIGAMADRLLAAAPERFVIAGLSMGGMVAMEVMARAPDRVLAACLMDTDPTAARKREVEWRNGLLAQGLPTYVETFVGRFFMHDEEGAAHLGAEIRDRMLDSPEPLARAQARALDTRREMAPLIAGFPHPVELLVGAEDRVCPARLHEPLVDIMPAARLTVIRDCGHIASLECASEVNAHLMRLIDEVDPE